MFALVTFVAETSLRARMASLLKDRIVIFCHCFHGS